MGPPWVTILHCKAWWLWLIFTFSAKEEFEYWSMCMAVRAFLFYFEGGWNGMLGGEMGRPPIRVLRLTIDLQQSPTFGMYGMHGSWTDTVLSLVYLPINRAATIGAATEPATPEKAKLKNLTSLLITGGLDDRNFWTLKEQTTKQTAVHFFEFMVKDYPNFMHCDLKSSGVSASYSSTSVWRLYGFWLDDTKNIVILLTCVMKLAHIRHAKINGHVS